MTYETIVAIATLHEGERGRIVYANGTARAGVISTKDYGHTVDVMLDRRGGFFYGEDQTVGFQVMRNGRYQDYDAPNPEPEPERHETVRLFEPAPAVMPGQLTL